MSRPYVYDICAQYNDARTRSDVEWFVDNAGNLRLGDAPGFSRENQRRKASIDEAERSRWMRNHRNNQTDKAA